MAKPAILLLFFFFFSFVFFLNSPTLTSSHATNATAPKFSAIFFFGDSTVDTGNNDHLPTLFRSNHHPYGKDFPGRSPTGRFSNGLLVPDMLASALGVVNQLPPFLNPKLSDDELRKGVSFASAGSGYDDVTSALSNTASLSKQVDMFDSYVQRLKARVGDLETKRIIENALIVSSAGTNDMVLNFYDVPTRRIQFSIHEYQDFLIDEVEKFIKDLYDLGGRKFIIAGIPPIGCVPIQITARFKQPLERVCIDEQNADAKLYNSKLQKLIAKVQQSLAGSRIVYQDVFDQLTSIVNDPRKFGFQVTNRGCCGTGMVEMGPLCNLLSPLCENTSAFVFFDAIHPSERVYRYITDSIMESAIPKFI